MGEEYYFNDKEVEALKRIVSDWVDEGFTTPPYPIEYYYLFEKLETTSRNYDIKRPVG